MSCTVNADGGHSGVGSLTASQDGGTASAVANGDAVEVSADGVHTVHVDVTDGAGNPASTDATVQVDRTAPAATVTCAPDSGHAYTCTASGSDGTSGLAALSYSVDGAWKAVPEGGAFAVAKGAVRFARSTSPATRRAPFRSPSPIARRRRSRPW